jgi:hypothetical protein
MYDDMSNHRELGLEPPTKMGVSFRPLLDTNQCLRSAVPTLSKSLQGWP